MHSIIGWAVVSCCLVLLVLGLLALVDGSKGVDWIRKIDS